MTNTKPKTVKKIKIKTIAPAKEPVVKKYEEQHFVDSTRAVWNYSLFCDEDIANFREGTLYNAYEKFGSHQLEVLHQNGFYFSVWAPNATAVSVIGDFNEWKNGKHTLFVRLDMSGIWEGFIPGIQKGQTYKYHIKGFKGVELEKGDPYARRWELRPGTASITWQQEHEWQDHDWMKKRKKKQFPAVPLECIRSAFRQLDATR